jgi:HD-like signal output (HDOD) protein
MDLIWIIAPVAALAVAAGVLVWRRSRTAPPTRPRRAAGASDAAALRAAAATPGVRTAGLAPAVPANAPAGIALPVPLPGDPPAAPPPPWTMPPALTALQAADAPALDEAQRHTVLDRFREVPRPPRLLTQLVSMDLMQAASSHELMALVSGEPLIAAKVLGAVNSPAYGLSRTVASIGQAVTFLGLNSVRAICMQYVLMQTFKADSAKRARRLTAAWSASALAGELTLHPAQRVALPDAGGLTSAVVLSFLGGLAVSVGVPVGLLDRLPPRDAVARLQAEQALLGLGAPQIGHVLMQHWDLPPSIVAEVDGLGQALYTPFTHRGDLQGLRWAFGHLCVRLGERLAWGELERIEDFDLATDTSDELACARSFLADPTFAALVQALKSPHVAQRVGTLQRGLRRAAPANAGAGPAASARSLS